MEEKLRSDRLLLWSLIAQVPVLWLAIALAEPVLLLLGPFAAGLLYVLFRFGPFERHAPVEDELL
jgi:hypothetical protein